MVVPNLNLAQGVATVSTARVLLNKNPGTSLHDQSHPDLGPAVANSLPSLEVCGSVVFAMQS